MIKIKTAQFEQQPADFTDVKIRRLQGILADKKRAIDTAISMLEQVDKSVPFHLLAREIPYLDTNVRYILGDDWMSQASNDLLGQGQ